MARINLLPWREVERKRRQRDLGVIAAAALVATLALGVGVHLEVERMIGSQESRNALLDSEIKELDVQIKEIEELEKTKASLLSRMDVIQQLQRSRPEIVHLFDDLVIAIPDGVYLTSVEQRGAIVVVEGHAQSNARVSAFMRNVEASAWIGNPSLLLIEHKEKTGTGLSNFKLQFNQKTAVDKEGEGQEAAA